MSKESDDEYFFLLRKKGENLEGTVSQAGVITVRGTTLEVKALWSYIGKRELRYRQDTKLSPKQIPYIEIVLEETAWQMAEKVG